MEVDLKSKIISVTPTLDTSAYSDQDRFGSIEVVTGAVAQSGGTGKIKSLTLIDALKQAPVFDLLFFSALPTVASADNAALDVSDAEMAAKFLGRVAIVSADWETLASNSFACIKNIELKVKADAGSQDIYVLGLAQGAVTFASATPLTIKIGIEQD